MSQAQSKIAAPTVITCHMNADFDALSAMVAARHLYPDAVLVFPGSQEKNLRNFYIESLVYAYNFKNVKEIDLSTVKKLVMVDTRQKTRISHLAEVFDNADLTIDAYDHHPNTEDDVTQDGGLVLDWGSTATILCHELEKREIGITPDEANVIGLGIYEDTGSFTFNSTTPYDYHAASWLLQQGMDVTFIADLITRDISADQIALLNAMLESAHTHDINNISITVAEVSTDEYVSDFALLVRKMMDIEQTNVLFALGRMNDRVHLVARSRIPEVNVGQICASFGGGGHAAAASASIKDKTPVQVKDELFALLYSSIKPHGSVRQLMSHPPILIEDTQSTADACDIMTRFGLKAAPVVNTQTGQCKGVLEHQIADRAVSHGLGDAPATDYLMRSNATVAPNANLYDVMEIVLGQGQRLVPVIERDEVIGVLTRTDLINILIEEPARMPESVLPHRKKERSIKNMLKDRLPEDLFHILQEAGELGRSLGTQVYAVGGFVRDILMNTPNTDLDLVVEGDGIVFARKLATVIGGRVRAHHKFQTAVLILENGLHIDVATARLEYYEYPAALPTVELSSIKMDLYRRDFTINALAVKLNPGQLGQLVDFFGSQKDLKSGVIRVLHSLSFVEDPTRILRAIRFAQRYQFRIGGQTDRLIRNAMQLDMISKLSGSRIFHELSSIFEEEHVLDCLRSLRDYKILESIHPLLTLTPVQEELLEELEVVLDWYKLLYLKEEPRRAIVYLLALLNNVAENKILPICERLNLTNRQANELLTLRHHTNKTIYAFKKWRNRRGSLSDLYFLLEELPLEGLLFFMAKFNKEDTRKYLSQYLTQLRGIELDISGTDLQHLGLEPGPRYGEILRKILASVIDGEAACRDDQLFLAKKLVTDPDFMGIEKNMQ